jgi:hypothetical protein
VIAAFAGLVHDRQSAAEYESNHDNDSCYGGIHCNLHASGTVTCAVSATAIIIALAIEGIGTA